MTLPIFLQCLLGISGLGCIIGLALIDVDRLTKGIAMSLTTLVVGCAVISAGMIV